jgi:hypothetical protein
MTLLKLTCLWPPFNIGSRFPEVITRRSSIPDSTVKRTSETDSTVKRYVPPIH